LKIEISYDELSKLYIDENKTDKEIAQIYSTSVFCIWELRKKYGLKGINARHRKFFDNPQLQISPRQLSIIMGSLLGDACLKSNRSSSYLSISHTTKQKGYINWLYSELQSICPTPPKHYISKGKYITYYFASESRTDLNEFRNRIYTPKKIVNEWWLNYIDELALSVWYMDDGTLQYVNKNKSIFSFATNSFSQQENYLLAIMLKDKFGLDAEVKPCNKKTGIQYNLLISDNSFSDFKDIVSQHIVSSMEYKLPSDLTKFNLQKNIKTKVDKEILERLYYKELLTQDQIAVVLGVHKSTVRKYMNIFSIHSRENKEAQIKGKNNKCKRDINGRFKVLELSEEEEKKASYLFRQMRSGDFPYPLVKDDERYIGIIDKLYNSKDVILDNSFPYSKKAIGICSSFCPQIFAMASDNSLSPLQIFNDDNMFLDCVRRTIKFAKKDTIASVRQGLKTYKNNRSVTIFSPEWAKAVVQYFFKNRNDLSMLDFSCGFGGRLIGAYSSGIVSKYVGIDPLEENIVSNKKIYSLIKKHSYLRNNNFEANLINDTAEDVLGVIDEKFDIVLTSPPYFNKEVYSGSKKQCYNKYSNYSEWKEGWLREVLNIAYDKLKEGGTMAIFMGDCGKIKIKDDCKDIMFGMCGSFPLECKFSLPNIEYNRGKDIKKFDTCFVVKKSLFP